MNADQTPVFRPESLRQILVSRPSCLILLCLVILGTVVTFGPGIQNAASGDDFVHIFKNQSPVRDWGRYFVEPDGREYRPLVRLSLAIENSLWRETFTPRHALNLIIHLANIFLVFFLGKRLTGSRKAAIASASLFALHPVHTYSVNAVMGRTDTLLCLFFASAILAAIDKRTVLAGVLFILALLTKELAITFPLVLCSLALFRGGRLSELWKPITVSGAIGCTYLVIRFVFLRVNLDDLAVYYAHSPLQLFKNLVYYAGTLVFPFAGQSLRLWQERHSGLVLAAAILGCAFILLGWKWRRQLGPPFWMGVTWSTISLLPVLFLFQRRFLYLASVGFCISVAWILSRHARRAGLPILLLVLGVFGWKSYVASLEWRHAGEEATRILNTMDDLFAGKPKQSVFLANVPNGLGEAHLFTHDSIRYAMGLRRGRLPAVTVLSRLNYSDPSSESVQAVAEEGGLITRIDPTPAHYFVFDSPSLLPRGGRFLPQSTRFRKGPFLMEVVGETESGQSSELLIRWKKLTPRQELWIINAWAENPCTRISETVARP